jgi:GxxExxY protein
MQTNDEYMGNEGYALMGAAFEVFNELKSGLSEEIYQESLEVELSMREIPYSSKAQLNVWYKGQCLEKTYIPDLWVFGQLIVELKAVKKLLPEHEQQLLNYLHITKKPVGYLINFGAGSAVEWKRFILSEYIPK